MQGEQQELAFVIARYESEEIIECYFLNGSYLGNVSRDLQDGL